MMDAVVGPSYVVLWAIVIFQSIALIAVFRWIGVRAIARDVAADEHGPAPGSEPAGIVGVGLSGAEVEIPGEGPVDVFFLSTSCPACDFLLKGLAQLELDPPVRHLFVVVGTEARVRQLATMHGLREERVVVDSGGEVFRAWDVHARPFLVQIGPGGLVSFRGRPESLDELERLLTQGP